MSEIEETVVELTPWWKPVKLGVGRCWRYAIGPLTVYLQRRSDEWWLASEVAAESEELYRVESSELDAIPQGLKYSRFVFKKSPGSFCLKPRLLDRPVVVKTNQAVHIPPGEDITFYISSPVSVGLELGEGGAILLEMASQRLSDTWFGPSTRVGELCYATKTQARNNKQDIPRRPHRAVTPVIIHNHAAELLTMDKLSIPVPFLAVYGLPDGNLWTDPLTLEHHSGHSMAKLKIGDKPPPGANTGNRLAEAREKLAKGGLVRAFTHIFTD